MASVFFRGIESAPRVLDGRAVLPGPHAETADGLKQGMSELCELVIDARRNGREDGHESVPLKTSERQGSCRNRRD